VQTKFVALQLICDHELYVQLNHRANITGQALLLLSGAEDYTKQEKQAHRKLFDNITSRVSHVLGNNVYVFIIN